MFVDDQAWFTPDSIETDAPLPGNAQIYESLETGIVGTVDGDTFIWERDDGAWRQVAAKPIGDWTDADWTAFESGHLPTDLAGLPEVVPPDFDLDFTPLAFDMGLLAPQAGLLT